MFVSNLNTVAHQNVTYHCTCMYSCENLTFRVQCEVSLQTSNDESVQLNDDYSDNYYNYSGGNLSSLSVADVHVTTLVPVQQTQHVASSSSSSSSSSGDGERTEFGVIINQSHYELSRPPLPSRDVIVYVIQLVCIYYAQSGVNPFNASWSKLLLFEGFSAVGLLV